jgi:hypothetical protein
VTSRPKSTTAPSKCPTNRDFLSFGVWKIGVLSRLSCLLRMHCFACIAVRALRLRCIQGAPTQIVRGERQASGTLRGEREGSVLLPLYEHTKPEVESQRGHTHVIESASCSTECGWSAGGRRRVLLFTLHKSWSGSSHRPLRAPSSVSSSPTMAAAQAATAKPDTEVKEYVKALTRDSAGTSVSSFLCAGLSRRSVR